MKCFELDLSPDGKGKLTAYLQSPSPELSNMNRRPAVIICPGGAYLRCSDREAEPVALSLAAQGFQVFVLRYTVGKDVKFPQPLLDAEGALRCVRDHAEEWLIDPDKICVGGFSAGAHLAACLGTFGSIRPNALFLGYGALDMSLRSSERPSPVDFVDAHTPPSFLFHTAEDPVCPVSNSLSFAMALSKADVPFELHIFEHGQHGMATGTPRSSNGFIENVDEDYAKWIPLFSKWQFHQFGQFETPKQALSYLTAKEAGGFTSDVQIGDLLRYPQAKAVLLSYLPNIESHPMPKLVKRYSVTQYAKFDPEGLPEEKLEKLIKELAKLSLSQE